MKQSGFIALPALLAGISTKAWEYLAIAVVVALYTGFVYHQGGKAPQAALTSLEASIKNAQRLHEAEDKMKEAESITVISNREKEYEKNAVIISAAWKSYADSLRKQSSGSSASQGPKPDTPIVSLACNDPAKDALVSAAFEGYRRETRAAITEYRLSIAGLFEQADKQAEQLITLQSEVAELAKVNQ